jgi:release factor glutamine methyltransferase
MNDWTVLRLVEWGAAYLAERGFEEARLHVELLLGRVLNLPRLNLYLQFDRLLTAEELAAFKELFRRRLSHEPLQYVLGTAEFMGLALEVGPGVLVPRPETEGLVESVIRCARGMDLARGKILEVGTGSGNIAAALGHFLPGWRIVSVDASESALAIAERNVRKHAHDNVTIRRCDILREPVGTEPVDMIVSNPPYVSVEEFDTLQPEVRLFEPREATTDGADGLTFYHALAAIGPSMLLPGGWCWCEIGYGQESPVSEIFRKAGFEQIQTEKDFAGIPRVLGARSH